MSITFTTDLEPATTPAGCCLCTQMAPRFCEAVDLEGEERALPLDLVEHLRAHASPGCHCKGSGLVEGAPPASSYVNLGQANGLAVLAAMGRARQVHGKCLIQYARAALARALSYDLRGFERAGEHVVSAAPLVEVALGASMLEGVAPMQPAEAPELRRWAPAFTAADMRERLERLLAFVEQQLAEGATEIRWS